MLIPPLAFLPENNVIQYRNLEQNLSFGLEVNKIRRF